MDSDGRDSNVLCVAEDLPSNENKYHEKITKSRALDMHTVFYKSSAQLSV